jgi:hypothetical protein
MIVRPVMTGDPDAVPPTPPPAAGPVNLSLEGQVQNGLSLFLPLKSPAQMPAVQALLQMPSTQKRVHDALAGLDYVHFARFMPAPDGSALWVITEYDGGLRSYVMDFVAVLGDVFTEILQFVQGAPRLPVSRYPRDFAEFIDTHNLRVPIWAAYPDTTVIDILHGGEPR